MSTILDLTADHVASAWLSDVPAGEYIAPFVSKGISAMLKKLHEVSAASSARDPDRWARQLFAIPRRLKSREEAAEHVARLIQNWLPEDMRTCGAAMAKEQNKPLVTSTPGVSSDSTGPVSFDSLFADLRSSPKFQEVKGLLEDIGKPAVSWTPDQVDKLLRRLAGRFIKKNQRIQRFQNEVLKELASMPIRYQIATILASSELAVPMLRSTPDIGKVVHPKLQTDYIGLFNRPPYRHRIVAERLVYRPGEPSEKIAFAATQEQPADFTLTALEWSRLSPFSSRGQLSDDLVDLTQAEKWEMKPVGSAPQGVLQESAYRMLYNFCATVLLVLNLPVKVEGLTAGRDWEDFAAPLLKPIPGTGWTAKPFCLDLLPGLVLYFVIKGLSPEELAALEAIIIAILMAYLKRLAEKLRQLGEAVAKAVEELIEVANRLAQAIAKFFLAFLLLGAIIVAVVLLFSSGPVVVAGAAAAATAALLIIVVGGIIVFLLPEDSKAQPSTGVSATATARTKDRATVSFGHCTILNFPVGQFPKLVETVSRIYQKGLKAAFAELSKFTFPEPTEGTVPVAQPM